MYVENAPERRRSGGRSDGCDYPKSWRLLDQELFDPVAALDFGCEPARLAATSRPGFARIIRIGVLGRHFPTFAAPAATKKIGHLEAGRSDHRLYSLAKLRAAALVHGGFCL